MNFPGDYDHVARLMLEVSADSSGSQIALHRYVTMNKI